MAQHVQCPPSQEIIFARNLTDPTKLDSEREPNIGESERGVRSIMEHDSSIVPWHFRKERHGAMIKGTVSMW
ncbi:hypothetical protein [Bradyrhizobium sp. ARR65]|uniref:hypothetical protein n=1 Tax=Bradyrhizobium sp. ARR65 TaxID=1040989 RepID=UPI000463FBE2|nr:hypothetical protein [Bradyrhizobium sp. ARR65]